jgi:DNA-binding CsgD family transcriptional regulator
LKIEIKNNGYLYDMASLIVVDIMAIPRPHSQKEIKERREKMLLLMSKGLNHSDIAAKLNTTTQTVYRDMKAINDITNDNLNNLARATLSTMYQNCVTGINEVLKECWRIYNIRREDDSHLTWWHRIAALRLATEINDKKFSMFMNGPAIMEVRRLKDEVTAFTNDIISKSEVSR